MTRTALLLGLAAVVAGCPDPGLRRLNFGSTALVTGDFDTVQQLIQEIANSTEVQAEIHYFDGYIDGPHFSGEDPMDGRVPAESVETLLRADTTSGLDGFRTAFFACGMRGVNDHQYNGVAEDNHLVLDGTVVANVESAVQNGLNLYFSDWTYDLLEASFPDRVRWIGDDETLDDAQRGLAGDVLARIVDPDLAESMGVPEGTEIDLLFNQGGWAVPREVAEGVRVLVRGDVSYDDPETGETLVEADAPLVFAFEHGGGNVVYTSFHNEAQITDDARDVLRYSLGQLSH